MNSKIIVVERTKSLGWMMDSRDQGMNWIWYLGIHDSIPQLMMWNSYYDSVMRIADMDENYSMFDFVAKNTDLHCDNGYRSTKLMG